MKIRRTPFRLLFPAAVVIGLLASTAVAENWPRFRGPNGQGISGEKGIPVEWSENDLSWKIELAGTGHSSPVVWDDKVFITFAHTDEDEKTTKCTLMAVRASDGGVLWQKDYTMEPAEMNPLNSSAASTPAVDADGVYAIWFEANRTVVTAVDHQGETVIGHAGVGMHAAAVGRRALVLAIGHFAGIAVASGVPQIADGPAKGRIILARQPAVAIVVVGARAVDGTAAGRA